jgi:hypothetical protein
MKKLLLTLALTASATVASAQGIEFRVGPGAERERTILRERRPVDEEVVVRRRQRDVTGSTCRTVTIREEDDDGNRVTRRIRKCD